MKNSVKYYSKQQNRIKMIYGIGVLFLLISAIIGIMLGSTRLSFAEIGEAITKGFQSSGGARIFAYVRLPRTLASLLCGAALAVSGAVIQGVLANRLASPGIIGVNAGAGLAVTLCAAFGIYGGFRLSVFAFIGAFASVMLVSLAAQKWKASRGTVILIGVAMNSLLGAISDSVIAFVPEVGLISNAFKVGEFSAVTYQNLLPSAVLICLAVLVLLTMTNELDVLSLGTDTAGALGMHTERVRTVFLLLAALLAGCAVSVAGLLSFVGLIVPHIVRRIAGEKASHLLGLCALYGAAFVCLCDALARTLFAPYEIPVGIIMSYLGAPFFLFLLVKGKGGHKSD